MPSCRNLNPLFGSARFVKDLPHPPVAAGVSHQPPYRSNLTRKTFNATALGHIACRRRVKVLFERADKLFRRLKATRLDGTHEAEVRKLVGTDLLIIDDFALLRLDATETSDFYELVVERHKAASTVLTSNHGPG